MGSSLGGAHFSSLTQITPGNVARLGVAWVFDTGLQGSGFEDTPLVVGGTMYVLLPNESVIALDPESGRRIWSYDPHETRTRVSRGISYWPGTRGVSSRLVVATADGHLIELDPHTGRPIPGFADHGVLDLRAIEAKGYPYSPFGFTSPPAVFRDLLILGPDLQEGPSRGPPGLVTAVDAVRGRIIWTFQTAAQPGQRNDGTWGPGGVKDRAGPAAWGNITVDPKLGLVFVPTANPADSYYGADRPGLNLYANSVVALDAHTGRLRWYYQLVHHDLWDTDTVSTTLVDTWKDGHEIPAVAALTKSALLFILDRRTGKPIFGVRERPVPRSEVPGEHSSPTQPYPIEPPPLARQSATAADASTIRPAAEAYCRRQFAEFRNQGPYTPFQLQPTLQLPSSVGGGNWGGTSYDPHLGYVYVNTGDLGGIGQMAKAGSADFHVSSRPGDCCPRSTRTPDAWLGKCPSVITRNWRAAARSDRHTEPRWQHGHCQRAAFHSGHDGWRLPRIRRAHGQDTVGSRAGRLRRSDAHYLSRPRWQAIRSYRSGRTRAPARGASQRANSLSIPNFFPGAIGLPGCTAATPYCTIGTPTVTGMQVNGPRSPSALPRSVPC